MQPPEELVDSVLEGRCVAFVGAGFSAAVVPTWTRLLSTVAQNPGVQPEPRRQILELVASGGSLSLEAAAQMLVGELGAKTFSQTLASLLERPSMNETQERRVTHLRGIPFRGILTTNFDGVLPGHIPGRKAYRRILRPTGAGWFEDRYWHSDRGPPIVKLHGDVRRPESVVITRRDYRDRLHQQAAYASFLRAVFSTNTMLFLGCSFSDPYLNELRSEVLAMFEQSDRDQPVAYAVVNDAPPARVAFFRQHEGMEVLSYDTAPGGDRARPPDHQPFDSFLDNLYRRTNPLYFLGSLLKHKRMVWLDPNPRSTTRGIQMLRTATTIADAGFRLQEVQDVPSAVATLSAEPADIVVTHWGHHPDGSNAERLLAEMRSHDLRAPVIVFASGDYADENKRTALKAGAIGYCFRWSSLFRRLRDVFDDGRRTG